MSAALAAAPPLVNAVGPHPFWGGRPQALHVAIERKRRDMFDLLLERGADVNGANDSYDHWSPLMLASNQEGHDMRDELLRRGARVGLVEALLLDDDDARRGAAAARRDGSAGVSRRMAGRSSRSRARRSPSIACWSWVLPTDVKDRWGSTPIDAMSRLGPSGQPLVRYLIEAACVAAPEDMHGWATVRRSPR